MVLFPLFVLLVEELCLEQVCTTLNTMELPMALCEGNRVCVRSNQVLQVSPPIALALPYLSSAGDTAGAGRPPEGWCLLHMKHPHCPIVLPKAVSFSEAHTALTTQQQAWDFVEVTRSSASWSKGSTMGSKPLPVLGTVSQ